MNKFPLFNIIQCGNNHGMRKSFVFRDGKLVEVGSAEYYGEQVAPNVITDTLEEPLLHPVTQKMHTSKSAFRAESRALGLTEVGNDLLSKQDHRRPDKISEAVIMDRIAQAESIVNDPSKRRAFENMNMERYERYQQAMKGNK